MKNEAVVKRFSLFVRVSCAFGQADEIGDRDRCFFILKLDDNFALAGIKFGKNPLLGGFGFRGLLFLGRRCAQEQSEGQYEKTGSQTFQVSSHRKILGCGMGRRENRSLPDCVSGFGMSAGFTAGFLLTRHVLNLPQTVAPRVVTCRRQLSGPGKCCGGAQTGEKKPFCLRAKRVAQQNTGADQDAELVVLTGHLRLDTALLKGIAGCPVQ